MKLFKEIISEKKDYLGENQKALLILKKTVNETIFNKIQEIVYKNNILFLYMCDHVWATQIMQYKQRILNTLQEKGLSLKELRILTAMHTTNNQAKEKPDDVYSYREIPKELLIEAKSLKATLREPIERLLSKQKKNKKNVCSVCGSDLIKQDSRYCSLCVSQAKDQKNETIHKLLNETPWIKYEEIDINIVQGFSYKAFQQEKKFKTNKIYDIIEKEYILLKTGHPIDLVMFKTKIEEYVILKLSMNPNELNSEAITNNIPKKWNKIYANS